MATREIDPDRVAVWAFSGGRPLLASVLAPRAPYLHAAVSYYAFPGVPAASPAEARLSALEQLKTGSTALPPMLIARAGRDDPALNATVDAFVQGALASGVTLELLTHPAGRHALRHLRPILDATAAAVLFAVRRLARKAHNLDN